MTIKELFPLVSIVTPAYNSARFVEQTIQSVQDQTYTNWELIIVDDYSKDDTRLIVSRIAQYDKRIRLICLSENGGPANARNVAIKAANGRYIAFLDSDDLWLPNKLEYQITFMLQRGIIISYTNYRRMSENGGICGRLIELPAFFDYRGLLKNTGIAGCLTVIVDRVKIDQLEMPNIPHAEDLVLWLKLLKQDVTAYGLNNDLARYRIVGNSTSHNKVKAAVWVWKVYREIEKLGFITATWYFICYAWSAYQKSRSL